MADITEIKRMLADRAEAVARHLLPAGRREGQEWRVGSIDGEAGGSLGVHLGNAKSGVWSDFATGAGGDLLDLWCATRRVGLIEALDEARAWLGIERPNLHRPAEPRYARPPKPRCRPPERRVFAYLSEDRNLPRAVIEAYRVGEDGDDIVFPFLLPDGTLALVKRRRAEAGAKPMPTAKDCEPVLFGWQAIAPDARVVVITEGEIDALSWAAYGHPALSVPFGGGDGAKQRWIEREFDRMRRFERIYLATDNDAEGEKAAREIARRLGLHRCLRVTMPRKDANECLVDGVPKAEMDRAIADAKRYELEGLRAPSEFADAVVSLFWPDESRAAGYRTPWARLGERLVFRPAEVTIWTGDTGAGKSQVLGDCAADWVRQGSRLCLSSLEMKPEQTLKRLCRQVVGVERPTHEAIVAALDWLDQGLVLYELTGKQKVERLLEVFDYARARYGCDQFVIDSLMRLGVASGDYDGLEEALFRIVDWTVAQRVHTHLVAHARKGEKDRGVPVSDDVKGPMELGANAHNIIGIWRNRRHEEAMREAADEAERLRLWREKSGVILNVAKQRNGDYEGKIGLWFDARTYRYRSADDPETWKRRYLPEGWSEAA